MPELEGREPAGWRLAGVSLQRTRVALRLQHELGTNRAAIILDIMAAVELSRKQLNRLQ